jgi:hypothetical protein
MCGRVEQRRGAYCYSCLLPSEVFTRRLLRKKRKKRRKQIRASHGPRWWSLMADGVLEAEREEGDREIVL